MMAFFPMPFLLILITVDWNLLLGSLPKYGSEILDDLIRGGDVH
jgi:hypothetical protein